MYYSTFLHFYKEARRTLHNVKMHLPPALSAGTVDEAVAVQQDLRHGDDAVAVRKQRVQDSRQRLGGMLGGVMEEHDAAGLDLVKHAVFDVFRAVAGPVQTVHIPLNGRDAEIPNGADEETAFALALADPKVQEALAGKPVRKQIYVQNKLVNFVAN